MNENKKLVLFDFDGVLNKVPLHDSIQSLANVYELFIVSSSYGSEVMDYLKKHGYEDYFSGILGLDIHQSKEIKIKYLLEKNNIPPSSTVLITDTLGDIREANACFVVSIGVTWGIHDRETLSKGNPVEIIDDPRDLVGAIENVLK